VIIATARPGTTVAQLQTVIDDELARLRREPPEAREVRRAINEIEASFYRQIERVGGFSGKADQLNAYFVKTGNADFFAEDLARYTPLSPTDVQATVRRWLPTDRRVELIVEPEAKK
jgi:zinc protease